MGFSPMPGIMKKTLFALMVVVIVLISYFGWPSGYYLQVVAPPGHGEVLIEEPVAVDGEISLIFTHSVHKTPVVEVFRVGAHGEFFLVKTGFQDYGVGIPFWTEHDFSMDQEGFFWIENMDKPMEDFSLRVQAVPDQRLLLGDREIRFLDHVGSGTLVEVRIISRSWLNLWTKERFRW